MTVVADREGSNSILRWSVRTGSRIMEIMALTIYVFDGSLAALLDLQSDRSCGRCRGPRKTILSVNIVRIQWRNFYGYFLILKYSILEVDGNYLVSYIDGTVLLQFAS